MNKDDTLFTPPRGMRDFYPDDMELRNALFEAWKNSARRFGFRQYDSCVVESLDLLKRKAGEEITDQIYAFTDKSGRELALRPEMTPTLARMVAAQYGALNFPLKWFSIAQCFRYERMSRGRKREHYQWNLDIVGESSATAETEIIATAIDALLSLGLKQEEFLVHFSSRSLLGDILLKLGIKGEHHGATFLALDKRGKASDDEIKEMLTRAGLDAEGVSRVSDLMGISSLADAAKILGEKPQSYRHVEQFGELAASYGMSRSLKFDISVVRGLAYYTGIVFEAFDVNRRFRAIFGGGRYDNLLGDIGGKSSTGVGLGFGDVVATEILTELGRAPAQRAGADLAVGYMQDEQLATAVSIATAMRNNGKPTDLALRPEKAKQFFARAGKNGFREAVYIGPDDVAKGTVRIKDLATRAEKEVPLRPLPADRVSDAIREAAFPSPIPAPSS